VNRFLGLSIFIISVLLTLPVAAQPTPKLDSIMRQHIEAMGGLTNWNRVESIRLAGTVEREGQTVDIVIVKKRPDKIRATVTIPIPERDGEYLQLIRAHDGRNAWTAMRLAGALETHKTELSRKDARGLLADAGILPRLYKFWRTNKPLQFSGTGQFSGEKVYIIKFEDTSNAAQYRFYLSTESYHTLGYEIRSEEGTVLTQLSAYIEKAGVFLPTHSETTTDGTGTGRSVMRTESIQVGIGIYADYFKHSLD
jgi:hypothetical protein